MKQLGPDQRIQQLLHKCEVAEPELLCASKNKISLLCVNTACQQPSLHCQAQNCQTCLFHQENGCSATQLKFITGLVKKQSQSKKLILRQMMAIETKMMDKLHENKEKFENFFKFTNFEDKELRLLQSIYFKQAHQIAMTGIDSSVLVSKLQKNKKQFSKKQEQILKFFEEEIEKVVVQLINLQKEVIQRFTNSKETPIQIPKVQAKPICEAKVQKQPVKERIVLQKLDQLFKEIEQKNIVKVCNKNFKVSLICQHQAFNYFYCKEQKCESCSMHNKKKCSTFDIQEIAQIFRNKFESKQKIFRYFAEMENKVIQGLKQGKAQIQKSLINDLDQALMTILGECYGKQIFLNFNYRNHKNICSKLMQVQKQSLGKQQRVKQFSNQVADYLINYLKAMQVQILKSWIPGDVLFIDSKIVNQNNLADIEFLRNSHTTAKRYELLYRGSQNGFSARLFHKKCANIKNIFVLAKSQRQVHQQKKIDIIAAYSPQSFQLYSEGYTEDQTGKSFLLFFTNKLKFMIKRNRYAVYSNIDNGPCFGGLQGAGFDLCIADQCDKYANSYSSSPSSYRSIKEEENERRVFSPDRFRVIEYQVFRTVQ